ncbi:hypothetical protein D6D26_05606, partial [Aureobasidium pullulans]
SVLWERNKEEQEGYKPRKERPSANPGLLLLLEVQSLQCSYDRKKSHWNYMRVYSAPARTRGNGSNFNITQAAGRSAAIDRSNATKCSGVGLRFLVRPSCLLVLGWLLGRLDGSGGDGAWLPECWPRSDARVIMGSKTGKHFVDLLSTNFPPGRSCKHCTFAIDEATQTTLRDGGHVLSNGLMTPIQGWLPSAFRWSRLGQHDTPTPRMLETQCSFPNLEVEGSR